MKFKKKLENFFYYYKWHVVGGIAAILILIPVIMSFTDKSEPDLNIIYVSDKYVSIDVSKNFEKSLNDQKLIHDIDNDGKKTFVFDPLVISYDDNNQDMAIMQKLQVYMMAGEQTLMLVHRYVAEDYDGAFEDISKYDPGDGTAYTGREGFVTAISVEGNRYLEGLGINTENLYVTMHTKTQSKKKDEKRDKAFNAAYEVLEYILNNK